MADREHHTFVEWKKRGYQVQKGEKSHVVKVPIGFYTDKSGNEHPRGYRSYNVFYRDQVAKIKKPKSTRTVVGSSRKPKSGRTVISSRRRQQESEETEEEESEEEIRTESEERSQEEEVDLTEDANKLVNMIPNKWKILDIYAGNVKLSPTYARKYVVASLENNGQLFNCLLNIEESMLRETLQLNGITLKGKLLDAVEKLDDNQIIDFAAILRAYAKK
jgi:hypothetical protein